MKALLLSVGDEVLCGKVVNTNASFLAIELEKIGIETTKVVTIGDDRLDLIKEVKDFLASDIDIIVTTGGLGPTHDDFTKEVLFETAGIELVFRQEPLDLLNKYFQGSFAKCNLKQTYYPKDAFLLPNEKDDVYKLYLTQLYDEDYVEKEDMINPLTNEQLKGCIVIKLNDSLNKYTYTYQEDCN